MFFFFDLTNPNIYGITSIQYNPELPIRTQHEIGVANFIKLIKEKAHPQIPVENVLVLWYGLPEDMQLKKALGHSNEWLLYMFSKRISSNEEAEALYIDSPNTLADHDGNDLGILLKHMIILYKSCKLFPTYLQNDFWEKLKFNELPAGVQNTFHNIHPDEEIQNRIEKLAETDFSDLIFDKIFLSLENLLSIQGYKFIEDGTNLFIHQYFMYQSGTAKVKECADMLDGVSVPSFYRYITEFENNPLYIEYLVAYQHILKDTPRIGSMPDPLFFMRDYQELFRWDTPDVRNLTSFVSVYDKYNEIPHILEIPRIKLACDKKINLMKRKSLYKHELAIRGLDEMDLK